MDSQCKSSMAADIRKRVEIFSQAKMPTPKGDYRILVFREYSHARNLSEHVVEHQTEHVAEHLALVMGEVSEQHHVMVRIHSECLTSEVFGSLRCDCKAQLDHALSLISQEKQGVLVYLRQEGRGIGLGNKIQAYALQDKGHDTYEANHLLGFPDDLRDYDVAAHILCYLGIQSVNLITNNPLKIAALKKYLPVHQRIPSLTQVTPENQKYLRAKQEHSGHLLELSLPDSDSCRAQKTG